MQMHAKTDSAIVLLIHPLYGREVWWWKQKNVVISHRRHHNECKKEWEAFSQLLDTGDMSTIINHHGIYNDMIRILGNRFLYLLIVRFFIPSRIELNFDAVFQEGCSFVDVAKQQHRSKPMDNIIVLTLLYCCIQQ